MQNFAYQNLVVAARDTLPNRAFQSGQNTGQKRSPRLPPVPGNVGKPVYTLARETVGNFPLARG